MHIQHPIRHPGVLSSGIGYRSNCSEQLLLARRHIRHGLPIRTDPIRPGWTKLLSIHHSLLSSSLCSSFLYLIRPVLSVKALSHIGLELRLDKLKWCTDLGHDVARMAFMDLDHSFRLIFD